MKTPVLAAMLLAFSMPFAMAEEDSSLSGKTMKDLPAKTSGETAKPTAKPDSGSLSEKAMNDQPGVNKDTTGKTADPTAKPDSGSLSEKAMKDNPGVSGK
jgi:hypothetical protein